MRINIYKYRQWKARQNRKNLIIRTKKKEAIKAFRTYQIQYNKSLKKYECMKFCDISSWKDFNPDHILYVVDNRQGLHFEQVFRASDKAGIVKRDALEHLAYGTVNGTDGKPYKTRNGDNPKLENLFEDARNIFISKKESNKDMDKDDVDKIVNSILKSKV